MRRATSCTQVSMTRTQRKNEPFGSFFSLLVRSTLRKLRNCACVRSHATLCVAFARYVHCARFPQMLCACVSLRLWSTETCPTAIVTEGQSRATDGARPNNASIVACKLFNLQWEFKFGVRKKRKSTKSSCLSFCGAVTET